MLSMLANYWQRQGRAVTLITLGSADSDFYKLDEAVARVALDAMRPSAGARDALANNLRRVSRLRKAIRNSNPDVVISFTDTTNILVLLATRTLGIPVVVSERIDPRYHPIGRGWTAARRLTYRWASTLVVQTGAVREWAREIMPVTKVWVVPNPVVAPTTQIAARVALPSPCVLAIGRLATQKGFDLLIRSFAQVAAVNPQWSLVIVGEGAERENLVDLAKQLAISDRVQFPGRISEPGSILKQADMFVLSSRYEGFPNALLEAMSCGCAVISFDCPSGPAEFIETGVNGILVPPEDVEKLGTSIGQLMNDSDLRKKLGSVAVEVKERYSLPAVAQQWDEVLARVSRAGKSV